MSDTYNPAFDPAVSQRQAASNALNDVQTVPPAAATGALKTERATGYPATAGMFDPATADAVLKKQQNEAALDSSPALTNWVAGAHPAHVAAAQGALPSLAKIDGQIQAYFMSPYRQLWEAAKAQLPHEPTSFQDFVGQAASGLMGTLGIAQQAALLATPTAGGAATRQAADEWLAKTIGPENVQKIQGALGTALLGLMPEAPGVPAVIPQGAAGRPPPGPGEFATQREAGLAGRAAEAPPGFRHEIVTTPSGNFKYEPVPVGETIGVPPTGVSPAADTIRGVEADLHAESIRGVEEAVAESPLAKESPETIKDFLDSTPMAQADASIDATKLWTMLQEGKISGETFSDLVGTEDKSNAFWNAYYAGGHFALPQSDYVAALAGKPESDAIREITRFSGDGGISQADAKDLWQGEPHPVEPEHVFVPPPIERDPEFSESEHAALQAQAPAIEAAARQATQEIYLKGVFADGKALGMTEGDLKIWSQKVQSAQQAVYEKLLAKAKARIKQLRTPEWKAAYNVHYQDVANSYLGRPAVVAYNQLRSSTTEAVDLLKDNGLVSKGKPITFYRETNFHDTRDGEVPMDLFTNPRPVQSPHPYWKQTIDQSVYKGASFAEDPKNVFSKGYQAEGRDEAGNVVWTEKRPVTWVAHIKSNSFGDFRRPADVEKALNWYKKNKPNEVSSTLKRHLESGDWPVWEVPKMLKDLGWDAVRMTEHYGQALPNIYVTNPASIYWKYDLGMGLTKIRLDIADRANVSKELLDRLPKGIWAKDGEPLDDYAEKLGLASGQQLLEEMASIHTLRGKMPLNEWLERQIKAEAAERAKDELGWDLTPGGLLESAKELVDAPQVEDLLTDSVRALAHEIGEPLKLGDLKNDTLARYRSMPMKDATNVKAFEKAIRDNSRAVEMGLLRKSPEKLLEAFKQRQDMLKNYWMLKEAHQYAKKLATFNKSVESWRKNELAKRVDPEFVNQMHGLLEQVGIGTEHDPAHLQVKMQETPWSTFQGFWNNHGFDMDEDPLPRSQYGNVVQGINNASVDAFDLLSNSLKQLAHIGGKIKAGTTLSLKHDLYEKVLDAQANLIKRPPNITVGEIEHPTPPQALSHWLREVDSWLLKMEQMFIDLDYRDPHGPFNETVVLPLEKGKNWADDAHRAIAEHFSELRAKLDKNFSKWLKTRVSLSNTYPQFIDRNGDPYIGTKADILGLALHTGSASNWEILMRSWPKPIPRETFDALFKEHMTGDAWTYAQGMWDIFEKFKKPLFDMYERINGIPMTSVPALRFSNEHGEFAGGYYPVVRSPLGLPKSYVNPDTFMDQTQYFRARPASPHAKERSGSRAPLDLKLAHGRMRLDQIIHDIAFREPLMQADQFIGNEDLKAAIVKHYGPEYYGRMTDLIRKTAGASGFNSDQSEVVLNWIEGANRNAVLDLVGYSTQTVAKHFLSALGDSVATVGKGEMLGAVRHMLTNWGDFWNFVLTNSPEVRNRVMNVSEAARESYLRMIEQRGVWSAMQRSAFDWVAASDQVSAAPVWWATYWKYVTDPTISHETAAAFADQQVRQAHGASGVIDAAPFLRLGRERSIPAAVYKSGTQLMNFFSHKWNRAREIPQDLFGFGNYQRNIPRGLNNLIFILGVSAIVEKEVSEWYGAKIHSWLDALSHIPISGVPWANEIVSTLEGRETSGGSMMLEGPKQASRVVKDVGQVASGKEPKYPIEDIANTFGFAFGGPGKQAGNTAQFLSDYMTGREQNVNNPVDFLHGLVTGPQGLVPPEERGKTGGGGRSLRGSLRGGRL